VIFGVPLIWWEIAVFGGIEIGFVWRLLRSLQTGRISTIDELKGTKWTARATEPRKYWILVWITVIAMFAWGWWTLHILKIAHF